MVEAAALTDIQQQIRDLAREFAAEHIAPNAAEWDRTKTFPRDVIDQLGELGFLGMRAPEDYDGMGLDLMSYLLVIEELAAADASIAVSVAIHNSIPMTMLARHGTETQKDRWLRPMARGELLAGFALSEPDAGSDAASLRAQAVRQGDEWVLEGTKAWCTNGGTADLMFVMVRTDQQGARRGAKGITTFVVPTDVPGYRAERPEDKMGLRSSNTCPVVFDGLRLSDEHRVGDEGMGFVYALEGLDRGRISIAAQAVGIARAALEASVAYASERRQFGQAIADFQGIQFKLADMTTRVDAARALAHLVARMVDADPDARVSAWSAKAKLFASETAMWVTTQAVQIFGGYGYMRDYPVERLFRDAKVTEIYEGTSEVQRIVIARDLLASR
jgi:alkylation response protein AidB-like acyl-CoA dehydrogenase